MYLAEGLQQKWGPVLDHEDMPKIKDPYRKAVTAVLLENQERAMAEQAQAEGRGPLSEALVNLAPTASSSGQVQYQDPVLISMIRRAMPNLIAYDVCGVQPMTGPTGLIFAMRPKFDSQQGNEAFYNEPDTTHSADAGGDMASSGAGATAAAEGGTYTALTGVGVSTATAESFGITGTGGTANEDFQQMAFSIDRVTVTAKTRALKGEYSMELAQDLKAVHGLDAETELANILSQEILAEINREVIRTIYFAAEHGAQHNTATAGVFDLDVDANGRWSVEKFKGLMFQVERDANAIAKTTRRGKGNLIITSSDVASALAMGGMMDGGGIDDTGNTFVGTLNGRYRVYVDPYFSASATNFFCVGYKGASAYDAGIFYCPYVPLQMVRAVGENSFQPKVGFKTRYGIVSNPFGHSDGDGVIDANGNYYYRLVRVDNLM
tara:strand:+ start:1199 stop:2506 length:1308 start_codon:yes stop_codon:yes gene_type:complete